MKCAACEYENEMNKWTKLDISSSDSRTSVIGYVYDIQSNKREHVGRVGLFACPMCRTVTFA